jgi:endo-1,4-beta-D-glucanase Y
MRRSHYLPIVALTMLASSRFIACAAGGGDNGGGGTGTTTGNGGNVTTGNGGSNNATANGGANNTGAGGSGNATGQGGSGTGQGGATGTGQGGTTTTGAGGTTTTGQGGALPDGGAGGTIPPPLDGGTSMRPTGCPAGVDVLSDFEEGQGVLVNQGGRTGWWYVFADTVAGTLNPPATTPYAASAAPADDNPGTCNHFALHSTATGHTQFVGFGATFVPDATAPNDPTKKKPLSLAAADGITFKIKAGSGTQRPIWFELLNTETQPPPPAGAGTAAAASVDQFNTRGVLLNGISTTWQTVFVPFSLLIPRFLPSPGTATTNCPATAKCQAPAFNPASALGFQFSVYPDTAFIAQAAAGSTAGSYDIWVDDVALYHGDMGLGALPTSSVTAMHPFPHDGTLGTCTKPAGASGKLLGSAYSKWKQRFVTTANPPRVQRPENNNDSVSEGIAYGMLIAVYMNDKTLFDGLWAYWKANSAISTGAGDTQVGLMTWQIPGGNGTATDADEDASWALLMASRQWGGVYTTALATSMIGLLYQTDFDATTGTPKGGSQFPLVNPSYFAPAYYREFAKVDTGHNWAAVVTRSYQLLANIQNTTTGLVPAWCDTATCTTPATNMAATDTLYQYDAHRVPWRIGLDFCLNGATASAAQTYVNKTTAFFGAMNGVDRILDVYTLTGGAGTGAAPNSLSVVGTAAVGAMASGSNAAFVQSGYQLVLDGVNRATLDAALTGAQSGYSYYNATVGLLTLLTMSGNFYVM